MFEISRIREKNCKNGQVLFAAESPCILLGNIFSKRFILGYDGSPGISYLHDVLCRWKDFVTNCFATA